MQGASEELDDGPKELADRLPVPLRVHTDALGGPPTLL